MGLVIAFKAYDLEEKKFMGLVMRIGGGLRFKLWQDDRSL